MGGRVMHRATLSHHNLIRLDSTSCRLQPLGGVAQDIDQPCIIAIGVIVRQSDTSNCTSTKCVDM